MKHLLIAASAIVASAIPKPSLCQVAGERAEEARASSEKRRAMPRVIQLSIKDEEGTPLEGARIRAVLNNVKTLAASAAKPTTSPAGSAIINIPPYHSVWDIYVNPSDQDDKIGRRAYEIHLCESDWIRYDTINQHFDLTLPYVRKPIPLKAKRERFRHRRVNGPKDPELTDPRLPDLAVTEVGYDAELLELMPPHGPGKHTDFTMKITSVFRGFEDANLERSAVVEANRGLHTMDEGKVNYGNWTHSVTYRFPNKGDGIILSPQFWPYCKLTMPHKAPEVGYIQEFTLTEEVRENAYRPTLAHCRELMQNNGMFLRVRTQLDKNGNVVSAHYAKIVSPQRPGSGFKIFYNPTPNDRNLEYDLQTNLRWQELHPHAKEPNLWDDTYRLFSN
jgi:hypothetical protein